MPSIIDIKEECALQVRNFDFTYKGNPLLLDNEKPILLHTSIKKAHS